MPVNFLLTLFIGAVQQKWQEQVTNIPMVDRFAQEVAAHVRVAPDKPSELKERVKLVRFGLVRYVITWWILVVSMFSSEVRKRFKTWDSFQKAECHMKNYCPDVFVCNLESMMDDLSRGMGLMQKNYFINMPIVLPQIVQVEVYIMLGIEILANTDDGGLSIVAEWLLTFFCVIWLFIACSLMNPFGRWDDDLEMNSILDRNITSAIGLISAPQPPALLPVQADFAFRKTHQGIHNVKPFPAS